MTDKPDGEKPSSVKLLGQHIGSIGREAMTLHLQLEALVALLVDKGVLRSGEFTEFYTRYREQHAEDIRVDTLQRWGIPLEPDEEDQ